MILNALVDYYEILAQRGVISERGFSVAKVSFGLNISGDGTLLNVIPLKESRMRGKKTVEVAREMKVPEQVIRTAAPRANFLCDNCAYLLGVDGKGNQKRSQSNYELSRQVHLEILGGADGKCASAVKEFFWKWQPEMAEGHEALQPFWKEILAGVNLVFVVDGVAYAHEDSEILDRWLENCKEEEPDRVGQCLVTGKQLTIAWLHKTIRGVRGAQAMGASLVSFNADAYESYGKEKGLNAPVSEYAAFAYGTALNYLLTKPEHCQVIGDTTIIFWSETAEPQYVDYFNLTINPGENADILLQSIFKKLSLGQAIDDIDIHSKFYILGLSPNAARLSVRFFLQNEFGYFLNNIRKHYERLEIQKPAFDQREYLSIYSLLRETVNLNSRDKVPSPLLTGSLLRSILMDSFYPASFMNGLVIRTRAERDVTRGKAAGIKAYLLKNYYKDTDKEVLRMAVNENTNNRPYILGRLFAVLEKAQEEASPGIKATIKDRYFTSACATPALIFPQLLRLASHHTAKADYGKYREQEIGELLARIEDIENPFPTRFNLQEQGIFMVGYYQQVQKRYEKKNKEENK